MGVAHVHPARFDAEAVVDLIADAEFGLKQYARAKGDAVGALEIAGRTGVDGDAQPGPDVELPAEVGRDAPAAA